VSSNTTSGSNLTINLTLRQRIAEYGSAADVVAPDEATREIRDFEKRIADLEKSLSGNRWSEITTELSFLERRLSQLRERQRAGHRQLGVARSDSAAML
jgi:hypothetical protein